MYALVLPHRDAKRMLQRYSHQLPVEFLLEALLHHSATLASISIKFAGPYHGARTLRRLTERIDFHEFENLRVLEVPICLVLSPGSFNPNLGTVQTGERDVGVPYLRLVRMLPSTIEKLKIVLDGWHDDLDLLDRALHGFLKSQKACFPSFSCLEMSMISCFQCYKPALVGSDQSDVPSLYQIYQREVAAKCPFKRLQSIRQAKSQGIRVRILAHDPMVLGHAQDLWNAEVDEEADTA